MINMAVLNLKDIIRYFIKITVVIAIVIGLTKYFSKAKETVSKQAKSLEGVSLLSCLDTTIPGIASLNEKEEEKKQSPLKSSLNLGLGMLTSLEDKDTSVANNSENENTQNEDESENLVESENQSED